MTKRNRWIVLGVGCGLFFVLAWSAVAWSIYRHYRADPAHQIVGKWEEVVGGQCVEFLDDGSLITFIRGYSKKDTGKWEFLRDGRVKMDIPNLGVSALRLDYQFTGPNEAIFTTEIGGSIIETEYKRVSKLMD